MIVKIFDLLTFHSEIKQFSVPSLIRTKETTVPWHIAMKSSAMNGSDDILSASDLSKAQVANTREIIYVVLSIVFRAVLTTVVAFMSVCPNAINTVVFYKMGLSHGVTQTFFMLCISDDFSGVLYSTK